MPPAVALLNYISSGILWRIFCQTGIFAGVSHSFCRLFMYLCPVVFNLHVCNTTNSLNMYKKRRIPQRWNSNQCTKLFILSLHIQYKNIMPICHTKHSHNMTCAPRALYRIIACDCTANITHNRKMIKNLYCDFLCASTLVQ